MATRGRQTTMKQKEVRLAINICTDRISDENHKDLRDFKRLRHPDFQVVEEANKPTNTGNTCNIKITLKTEKNFGKAQFFEKVSKAWCSSICSRGDPFWLESAEPPNDTFRYNSNVPKQVLEANSFGFGSFFNRGTYIEHWSSQQDLLLIKEKHLQIEFEHDTKLLVITFFEKEGTQVFNEVRIEMEYHHLETYVVIDNDSDQTSLQKTIKLYIPLQFPPKVLVREVKLGEHTNYKRVTHFLRCYPEVLGSCSVLCLRLPENLQGNEADSPSALIARLSQKSFSCFFGAIKTKSPLGPTETPTKPNLREFKITYALECLLSRGYKVRDRLSQKFYDLLEKASDRYRSIRDGLRPVTSENICNALYRLVSLVETDRFCPLEDNLNSLLYGEQKHQTAFQFEKPNHYVYVPRLVITPTQRFLIPPELVAENRVIRDYGHESAMRIAFRDEDFSKLSSTHRDGLNELLQERVVGLLSKDIEIGGRKFEFLACSNSQLRDHGAWLYAVDGEHRAHDIRSSLGRLNEIRCVATYVSRMGQCFSSTKEAVTIDIGEGFKAEQIPDVEVNFNNVFFKCCRRKRSGKYTFSDGIGKISLALARTVADNLDLDPIPSAYQIRFGGCKGMLAIDPSFRLGNFREILQYRESMKKFDSDHCVLEICETSKPNLLYLNRQCIILLSGLGVPDDVFIGLQDEMLRNLASILLFESVALESLRRITIPGGLKFRRLSRSGIKVTLEPFFRSLLHAVYKSRLGDLLRRARIAIPETHGRLLMGVMDETRSLKYGQVFVRYSKLVSEPGKELEILRGRVVISKNPCFHPGDMRTFEAVDVEALHHLVDCVVFPATGPRPHPNEMSGSDLDGDKYFVTWLDKLVPTRRNEEAMDFTAPEKKTIERQVQVSDMIEFVSDYIKNDQLGIIANAHLVHADCDEKGIFSTECIKLAHMHSDAVDFPKTGECPTLPKELRPEQYPDFMMKPRKPQYKSNRILGKLFRKCHSLDRAQRFSPSDTSGALITPDEDLKVRGHEKYLKDAEAAKKHYNAKLEGLMSLYGLKNEGEVITGCLFRVNPRLSAKTDEKFEVAQMIQASLATLRARTREAFYAEFDGEEAVMEEFEENGSFDDEVMMKASAWYMVTYDQVDKLSGSSQKDHQTAGNELKLISFPWVVDRILAEIKEAKQKARQASGIQQEHTLNLVEDLITGQAAYFFESIQSKIAYARDIRIDGQRKLQSLIAHLPDSVSVPRLSLFGASLTGISDHSDGRHRIEIYVHLKWNASVSVQRQYLLRLQRFFKKLGDVKITRDSLLHFQPTQGLLKQEYYITADSNKMLTSAYVGLHIQRCPPLLHLLLIIMLWGRRRQINGYHETFFLTDEQLAIIFITFCEKSGFIDQLDFDEMKNFASSFLRLESRSQQMEAEDSWNRMVLEENDRDRVRCFRNNVTPGHVLIKFFEHYSTTSENDSLDIRRIVNPANRREALLSDLSSAKEKIGYFSEAALHAFHEIAQCCGLDSLTASSATEDTRELTETMTLPNSIGGALRFAEEYVRVKLSQRTSSQITIRPVFYGYIFEATGKYLTLHNVQKELEKLEATCQSYIYDHNVSGGTRFLFLNQRASEDPVEFKPLPGKNSDFAVNLKHVSYSTEDKAETKFLNTLSCQLKLFQREHLPYIHGSAKLVVRAEFGSIYAENILLDRSVEEVEEIFSESADPRNQSGKAYKKTMKRHKFMPFNDKLGDWSAAFPSRILISTRESFTLRIKASKNQGLTLVYDEDLTFCDVEIPPINWVVADIKTPRPMGARSRDTDIRITVCSERKLEADEKQDVMTSADYERFKSVIRKSSASGSDLELAKEQKEMVLFVRHDKTSVYQVQDSGKFWIEEREVKRYNVKGSRFLCNPRASSEVKIYGVFDGKDSQCEFAKAKKIARDIWAAAKKLQLQINNNVGA